MSLYSSSIPAVTVTKLILCSVDVKDFSKVAILPHHPYVRPLFTVLLHLVCEIIVSVVPSFLTRNRATKRNPATYLKSTLNHTKLRKLDDFASLSSFQHICINICFLRSVSRVRASLTWAFVLVSSLFSISFYQMSQPDPENIAHFTGVKTDLQKVTGYFSRDESISLIHSLCLAREK